MKKNILCLILLAFANSGFSADLTPSHTAAIEKLVQVLQIEKQLQASATAGFEAGIGMSSEQMDALPPEQKAKFTAAMAKVKEAVLAEMSWENMKKGVIDAYGKNYTEEQVIEITKLMETPAGQTYISKQTLLVGDMMKVSQDRMKTMMPKIMSIMQAEMSK